MILVGGAAATVAVVGFLLVLFRASAWGSAARGAIAIVCCCCQADDLALMATVLDRVAGTQINLAGRVPARWCRLRRRAGQRRWAARRHRPRARRGLVRARGGAVGTGAPGLVAVNLAACAVARDAGMLGTWGAGLLVAAIVGVATCSSPTSPRLASRPAQPRPASAVVPRED